MKGRLSRIMSESWFSTLWFYPHGPSLAHSDKLARRRALCSFAIQRHILLLRSQFVLAELFNTSFGQASALALLKNIKGDYFFFVAFYDECARDGICPAFRSLFSLVWLRIKRSSNFILSSPFTIRLLAKRLIWSTKIDQVGEGANISHNIEKSVCIWGFHLKMSV